MSNAAPNITDRLVAIKAFADRAVRTNEERIVFDSRAESVLGEGKKGYRSGMLNPSSAIQAEKLETQAEKSSIDKQRLESHLSR